MLQSACFLRDWKGLATTYPELCTSLSLVCPMAVDADAVSHLATRLLVVGGDQGPPAERVRRAMGRLSAARFVTLRDYAFAAWTDVAAERAAEIGSVMIEFLQHTRPPAGERGVSPAEADGEVAGISYRIRGSGPPLLLLPLWLSPSQWEPLVPRLSEQYCTITLGGAELGMVAVLESRGLAAGYLAIVRNLMEEVQLQPGETVLEVGCGTGVLDRWLAHHTRGENPVTGVDINGYLPLSPEEVQEWQTARTQAEAEGTFFIAWPHHCAVGTKAGKA